MRKVIATAVFALAAGSIVDTALAVEHDPSIKHREHRQNHRIEQGVRSGELTQQEAKGLRQEEKAIHQEERAFKSDGKLTRAERKQLHHDLNKTSKDIYNEKHDAEKRPGAQ
jgi:polyhydroxyalkanoate synthesis regulator phasin